MDIGAWLRGLGLERYERAFQDGAIDAEVLPELTDEHLRELGLPLGHRLKLLKAIAALREKPAQAPSTGVSPQAERRQLTVMFVDLVGSTALSACLDPEDLREVMGAYHRRVAEAVGRFEGHIAKYMGDGVLAYFGYPKAHEDDAERAVRAGLDLVEAVRSLSFREGSVLQARIGIATGLVVVGDLLGEGAAREEAVVGETPNLAARLQALAAPDSVVIGSSTQRLVSGLFECDDLGAQALKGLAAPVRAWRVLGPSAAESRFEARYVAGLTPLVGREEELALLLRRWEQAREGEGQVVLLSGEPGIGKSRLIRALRERLADEPHTPLRYQCSPHHINSALYPIIDQLKRAAGFERDDPAGAKLAKLEALLAGGTHDVAAVAPLFTDLLAVPAGGRYPPLDHLTPQRRKEKLFDALLAQLEGLAAKRPVLNVFEDAHWLDPTTEELLGLTVERVRTLPVLLVVTARPEFAPQWPHHAHVTRLTLNRLSRRQGAALALRVTGGRPLPPEVLEQIVARTDGVPLFVEELTKAVLESGLLRETDGAYVLDGPLPPLAIPTTLHDSLMARLDRLAPVKETAQVGACIGREFSFGLLTSVSALPEPALRAALDQLVASELVFARGTPPEASYVFKHALIQEAAYQSLLRSRRQQLHAKIAQVLEERFPDSAAAQPELLARHCTEAGLTEKAVDYWWRAGQLASNRSALAEAIGHFSKALELLGSLPETPARVAREVDLQTALGGALIAAKGYAAPETGRAYARARELSQRFGDTARLFPVLFGQWLFHMVRAEHAAAQGIAEELLRSAEREDDTAALVVGHRAVGISLLWRGNPEAARGHLERALALYDPGRHHSLASLYAYDPRAAASMGLCFALFQLGHPHQALVRCGEALGQAEELSHPPGLAFVLWHACMFDHIRRNGRGGVRERAAAMVELATEQGFPYWRVLGVIFHGWALAERRRLEEGVAAYRATGAGLFLPYSLALLAEAHGTADRRAEGLSHLAEALTTAEATGERWYEAELHRLRGELLLSLPEPDEAEACFRRAIEVARAQDAKMWELRAATCLARLWRDQGKRTEARDLLAPICNWFTEGFDTPDLRDAKALLDELR